MAKGLALPSPEGLFLSMGHEATLTLVFSTWRWSLTNPSPPLLGLCKDQPGKPMSQGRVNCTDTPWFHYWQIQ